MYDRITRGANILGALAYHVTKMEAGKADLIDGHRVAMPLDPHRLDIARAVRSFAP